MRHRASRKFWQFYRRLPEAIRHVADENYAVLKQDPKHPSLRFKKAGRFGSVRVGIHYRAVAVEDGSDLRKLSRGESIDQILESHPRLTREAILAALGYAAEAMGHETVHAVGDRKSA